jgi:hypothetical protein
VLDFAAGGRPGYLLGQISTQGWWIYFPVAFAVKTPLATLVGLLIATGIAMRRPSHQDAFLLFPPVVFFLASATARLNLGYRHLLPILPFLAVHIGRLASCARLVRSASIRPCRPCPAIRILSPPNLLTAARALVSLSLAIWLAVGALSIAPHFLAYFNPIGGGPRNGWRVLADSNVDWGQDMKGLRAWMEREEVDRVRLAWFGTARPDYYGVLHDLLPGVPYGFLAWDDPPFAPDDPEPGVYAISVSNLVGVSLPDPDLYAWFRERPPDDRIGHSVFIYRVGVP